MKTILLTGSTGFIGSNILRVLLKSRYKVIITIRLGSNVSRISDILSEVTVYNIDVVSLSEIFTQNNIEIVVHTATLYGRKEELESILLKTNLMFAIELLEAVKKYNTRVFINTDTFFNTDYWKYNYLNAYTLSKKQFLEWAIIICNHSSIKFVNIKLEHVYGPKDSEDKFIPWFIKQLKSGATEIELTSGMQKRDFIYVGDVAAAFLKIIENEDNIDSGINTFEVGRGFPVELRSFLLDIFNLYCETIVKDGFSTVITELKFGALPTRAGEPHESYANIQKLQDFGWEVDELNYRNSILECLF